MDGRPPALRLRADGEVVTFVDAFHGPTHGRVDDVVLRRNDGVPAYNLAVVVDDAAQGIEQVVRGDDLAVVDATADPPARCSACRRPVVRPRAARARLPTARGWPSGTAR